MYGQQIEIQPYDYKVVDKLNEKGLPIDSQVIDQYYSEKFMRGENGFAKTDVRMFLDAQSEDLKVQIAQRMQDLRPEFPDQKLTNEELIDLTIDRNIQSAPDFQRWFSSVPDKKLEAYLEAAQKEYEKKRQEQEKTISFDEDDDPKSE